MEVFKVIKMNEYIKCYMLLFWGYHEPWRFMLVKARNPNKPRE
jgi:hypothetical protein